MSRPQRRKRGIGRQPPTNGICTRSGKVIYPTERGARRAARQLPKQSRAYPCGFCSGWHVTAQIRR